MMDKDSQVKMGATPCDRCGQPAAQAVGQAVLCNACAPRPSDKLTKQADQPISLREAPIRLADLHK